MSVNLENVIYRFRNVDALLDGFHELENQEIYFSPYSDLNDPCEGTLNLYWEGDDILWKNLLKHYFFTFVHTWIGMELGEVDYGEINVFVDPTQYYISDELEAFLTSSITDWVLRYMILRKNIQEEELTVLLRMIHRNAVNVLMKRLHPEQVTDVFLGEKKELPEIERLVNGYSKDEAEQLFRHVESWMMQAEEQICLTEGNEKIKFILIEFPKKYMKSLAQLLYPNWYVACFCNSCTDARMWTNYASNHTGACLIFKTNESQGKKNIRLRMCHSWSSGVGPIYENYLEELHEVKYIDEFEAVNFFEMLGNVPNSLLDYWYCGEDGKESRYSFRKSIDAWRTRYWEYYQRLVTSKSKDWKEEKEARVMIRDNIFMRFSSEDRKIKYEFCELFGIVFGSRMSAENKKTVRRIVAEKCKAEKRTDFRLYEERFNRATREIELVEMRL